MKTLGRIPENRNSGRKLPAEKIDNLPSDDFLPHHRPFAHEKIPWQCESLLTYDVPTMEHARPGKLSDTFWNRVLGWVLNSCFRTSYRVPTMRRNFERLAGFPVATLKRRFPKAAVEEEVIDGTTTETIFVGQRPKRQILFLHGGGYFMGSISTYRRYALKLAFRCQAAVTQVDYRLAPEHPFPAALHDVERVYRKLLQTHAPSELIVAGDSAGGGLTLSLLAYLKKEKTALPAGAICISPWTDLSANLPSIQANHGKDVWLTKKHLDTFSVMYAPKEAHQNPLVSPLHADLSGFPPLLFLIGDQEVLLDDTLTVAEKARRAGVRVKTVVGKQMQHDWMISLPFLEQSKIAMKTIQAFVDEVTPAPDR